MLPGQSIACGWDWSDLRRRERLSAVSRAAIDGVRYPDGKSSDDVARPSRAKRDCSHHIRGNDCGSRIHHVGTYALQLRAFDRLCRPEAVAVDARVSSHHEGDLLAGARTLGTSSETEFSRCIGGCLLRAG